MGGKSAPAPMPVDPMAEARARQWEAEQAEVRANAAREREKLEKAAKDAETLGKWNSGRNTAKQNTEDYGRSKLGQYGIDPANDQYGIWNQFTSTLNRNNTGLQDNQDYSAVLGNNIFDNTLADVRGATRGKYAREFNQGLGSDYYDTTFADTIDDSILDNILNTQYGDASNSIKGAFERGQMNNTAYQRAMENLTKGKAGARGELETIGKGVIGNARTSTQRAGDAALGRANNFDFNDTFNVGNEVGKVRTAGTGALSTLGTDIERAVGDRTFFDPNAIIAKSLASGGVNNYNPADASKSPSGVGAAQQSGGLYDIFDDQARKKQTEGVF